MVGLQQSFNLYNDSQIIQLFRIIIRSVREINSMSLQAELVEYCDFSRSWSQQVYAAKLHQYEIVITTLSGKFVYYLYICSGSLLF